MANTHLDNAPVILRVDFYKNIQPVLNYNIPINYGYGKVLTSLGQLTSPLTYTALPTGVTMQTSFGLGVFRMKVEDTTPDGFYVFNLQDGDDNEYLITLNVAQEATTPTTIDGCSNSNRGLNIVFLTQQGGWDNFFFTGKKYVYDVSADEAKTFINKDGIKRKFEAVNVYKNVTVSTGLIPLELSEKLESLVNSIQAYYYDEDLPFYYGWNARFTPILFNVDAITVLDSDEKNVTKLFRFQIAKEVNIQTQ